MPRGLNRRSFVDPEAEEAEEAEGLRPIHVICVVGAFAAALVSLYAFDEVSLRGTVVSLGFAFVLLVNTLWRGLRTGKLVFRGSLIDGTKEPISYFGMVLFYFVMACCMIYFAIDLWFIEP